MGTLNWNNIKGAFISALLTAKLAVLIYVTSLKDIFEFDPHQAVNIGAMSLMTGIVSLLKSLLTSDSGKFLGMTKVK